MKIRRFTRTGYGLQFCPKCLAADPEPYFRKRWRVAFYTWCTIHDTMLHERCPQCGAPVIFQRREMGRPREVDGGSVTMADLSGRLTAAWRQGAVTYSALLRDFEDRPKPYDETIAKFFDDMPERRFQANRGRAGM